jgi:RAB protein geranylgeranyltransferase component A
MSILQQKQSNEKENELYFNFINSLKSDVTKEIYEYNIQAFMKFCNTENFYDLFAIPNAQTQIIKHLMSLREKGKIVKIHDY